MKLPTSCNDRRLLQDEPFFGIFQSNGQQEMSNKRSQKKLNMVVSALKEATFINDVIQAWVKYAFIPMSGDGRHASIPQPDDITVIRLFAKYYSHLARDDESAALQVLNEGRLSRGFARLDATALDRQIDTATRSLSTRRKREEQKSTTSVRGRGSISLSRSQKLSEAKHLSFDSREVWKIKSSSDTSCIAVSVPLQENNTKRSRDERDARPSKKLALLDPRTNVLKGIKIKKYPASIVEKSEASPGSQPTSNGNDVSLRRPACAVQNSVSGRGNSEAMNTNNVACVLEQQRYTEMTSAAPSSNLDCVLTVADGYSIICPEPPSVTTLTPTRTQRTECHLTLPTFMIQGNDLNVAQSAHDTAWDVIPTCERDNEHTRYVTQKLKCCIKTEDHPPICLVDEPGVTTPDYYLPTLTSDNVLSETTLSGNITHGSVVFEANAGLINHGQDVDIMGATSSTTENIFDIKQEASPLDLNVKTESILFNMASEFPPEPVLNMPLKKPLLDLPPIWAQTRQEVCESFDWFRSYQGGVYHTQDTVRGYLLSGFPSRRDRFEHDGRLIISHGGGKAESLHCSKGQVSSQPATDQLARDKSVRAILNNYRNGRPLALLIDDKYALFPYDLGMRGITYAVLGFYTVEHAWAEYQHANVESGQVVRYKFAFRWCEDQGQPWWIPNLSWSSQNMTATADHCTIVPSLDTEVTVNDNLDTSQAEDDAYATCYSCQQASPRVFDPCWVCLFPDCKQFWTQTTGLYTGQRLSGDLSYSPKFLELPPYKPLPFGFQEIVTSPMTNDMFIGPQRNYHLTRGFHCRECGRLSCRSRWEHCYCSNCGKTSDPETIIVSAKDIWNQNLPTPFKDYMVNPISDMVSTSSGTFLHETGRGSVVSFNLPQNRGIIHHIRSGTPGRDNEADHIFLEYQRQAASGSLKFRRWPLRAHKCRGSLLTSYFSHNAGKPYNYVAGDANTVPFEEAPVVCQARDLIQKRVKQALDRHTTFNEVLSAAYMERQKMAFHSDNEVGLGPLVAGLSLGSPALMHFRLHPRFDPEREKKGILLSIVLRHGDVLVMDGAGIQEYYEHTVVPNNFRIAATARQIGAAHI